VICAASHATEDDYLKSFRSMRPTQAFFPDLPSRSLLGSLDPRLDPQLLEARGGSERGCNGLGSPSKRNRASLSDPQSVGEEQLWLQSSSDLKPLKTPIVLMMVPPASSLPFG